MDLGLAGQVFVVTGGSRGLGRASAEALLAEGARVVLSARSDEAVRAAAAELGCVGVAALSREHPPPHVHGRPVGEPVGRVDAVHARREQHLPGQRQRQLDDVARACGLHVTGQVSARFEDLARIETTMTWLRNAPPSALADSPVNSVRDLAEGLNGLPPTDGVVLLTADDTRVIVRTSGTEPKIKAYLEVVVTVNPEDGVDAARISAAGRLDALGNDIRKAAGI